MNLNAKESIRVKVWLIEYKGMLEREAKSSNVPFIVKKKTDKANEIKYFLDRI